MLGDTHRNKQREAARTEGQRYMPQIREEEKSAAMELNEMEAINYKIQNSNSGYKHALKNRMNKFSENLHRNSKYKTGHRNHKKEQVKNKEFNI